MTSIAMALGAALPFTSTKLLPSRGNQEGWRESVCVSVMKRTFPETSSILTENRHSRRKTLVLMKKPISRRSGPISIILEHSV